MLEGDTYVQGSTMAAGHNTILRQYGALPFAITDEKKVRFKVCIGDNAEAARLDHPQRLADTKF